MMPCGILLYFLLFCLFLSNKYVTLKYHLGLTGIDSELEWYVSMQWVGNFHLNLSYQNFIWQRKLCSRCLIEV